MATTSFELEFIFKNVKFNLDFEDGYFEENEKEDIKKFVDNMSNEIAIDKSYVECKKNYRNDVFMIENGWNSLRDLIFDSRYCQFLHPISQESIVEAFTTMVRCYMYSCISTITDMYEHIVLTVDDKQPFDVIICKDVANDWNKYIGKWQDWEFDDEGKFISSSVGK